MDVTTFLIGWAWYLAAFLAGSLLAWLAAVALVRPTAQDEPPAPLAREPADRTARNAPEPRR